jgi:predicted adenylyl cyclase CyaB
MPSNVEIKAVLKNRPAAEVLAAELSTSGVETISQEDHFFNCEGARLKLRILAEDRGELIRYERTDVADVRCSSYSIARTPDPRTLLEILTAALGVTGVVRKQRLLYLVGQTRIHIDHVEGLGNFIELEVVLQPGQNEDQGKHIATNLLSKFGISKAGLIAEAYVDLLARQQGR